MGLSAKMHHMLDRELADEGDILDVWNDVKVQPFFPVNYQGASPDAFRAFKNLQDECPDSDLRGGIDWAAATEGRPAG